MEDIYAGIIDKMIGNETKGVDIYHNNGSVWLIFTDEKKWVIELTKEGTLWYNYYFFQNCFKLLSLDVVENQHYITKWVEDTILSAVNHTNGTCVDDLPFLVEDAIQNGVKDTKLGAPNNRDYFIEDTIENGVNYTGSNTRDESHQVEDTIQNGVKYTGYIYDDGLQKVEDTIQNGVKCITASNTSCNLKVEDTIENGVKQTRWGLRKPFVNVEDVIQNGVKRISKYENRPQPHIDYVVKNNIKETKSPDADGDLLSTIEWMESNNTKSVPEMIDDVITNGIKETKKLEHDRTTYHGYFSQERGTHTPLDRVQDVVKNGVKETRAMDEWVNTENILNKVINNGIKEVKELPDMSGELNGYGEYYARQEDRTYPHTYTVNDVIRDGVKETWAYDKQPQMRVNSVILNGTKLD